jgi:hypothetical protein
MRRKPILTILLTLAALPLAACAAAPQASDQPRTSRGNDCLFSVAVRDWRPLDDQNLILFSSGRVPYHVTLMRPAMGLDYDIMIGVYSRDGNICPYGGDAIIVDSPIPERISIRSIRRLNDDQLTQVYAEFGIIPPEVVNETEIPVDDGAE